MNNVLKSSNEMRQLPAGMTTNTDDSPVVEFNGRKCLYQFTTDGDIRMLFGELEQGEYTLPFFNLLKPYQELIAVPFRCSSRDLI